MDLSTRQNLVEVMDDPGLDKAVYQRCLADLAALNQLTFTHRAVLNWLGHATKHLKPGTSFSVLDIAYGEGDLLRAICTFAKNAGLNAVLSGIDLNPRSAIAARAQTPENMPIHYRIGDVFTAEFGTPDFIVSSQFTHHLSNDQVTNLLGLMEAHAARGWFITDLHRHAFAYYSFPWLARLMRWHKIVRDDGQASIARGFTKADWQAILAKAGLTAEIAWHIPFRYSIARLK